MKYINRRDWALLSAYLDGQLDGNSKQRLEQRLQVQEELQFALARLRHTRTLLRSLPTYKVPRNFTLSNEYALLKTRPLQPLTVAMRAASVFAAIAFVVIGIFDFLMKPAPSTEIFTERTLPAADRAVDQAQEPPKIIYWGPALGVDGDKGMGQPAYGIGGGGGEGVPMIEEQAALQEELLQTEIEPEMLSEEVQTPDIEPSEKMAAEQIPLEGGEPILGIAPREQRGQIIPLQPTKESQQLTSRRLKFSKKNIRLFEIVFASIAITAGAISWWLSKRR